jgi:hypothetical protein
VSDLNPEDYPPHLQWATDPAGRRYWIQGVPAFGHVGRALFSRYPGPPEVTGVVVVARVEGEKRTDVYHFHCSTLAEARAKAIAVAREIEAGTFVEHALD